MKILVLDRYQNLCWKDATYTNGWFCSTDNQTKYDANRIHSVKDDDRDKTVICSACGKEISRSPSAIKAHRNMVNKSDKCFNCPSIRHSNPKVISQKYVLNEDGTYSESTKRTVNLECNFNYRRYDINSEDAHQYCRYASCERATFKRIEDFWTKYPSAFDEMITVDRVLDAGYKSVYKCSNYISIELKGKAHITAYINNQGLCYRFELSYRRNTYDMRYSKKYDKVFVLHNGYLKELSTITSISADMKDIIVKKLRNLYE